MKVKPSGIERFFAPDELIVSKTDTKGRMVYVNDVFLKVSGYRETDLLDQPHSMIRHPDMPRSVFRLLWDQIESGREIFAYVKNMAFNGDHYWVFAHVTPSFDSTGKIIGYHSNRRVPEKSALEIVQPIYSKLLEEESRHADSKAGLEASYQMLKQFVADSGLNSYDRLIFEITSSRS